MQVSKVRMVMRVGWFIIVVETAMLIGGHVETRWLAWVLYFILFGAAPFAYSAISKVGAVAEENAPTLGKS